MLNFLRAFMTRIGRAVSNDADPASAPRFAPVGNAGIRFRIASDAGLKVVEQVRRTMQPDEIWTRELERGFEFWPGPSSMMVTAETMRLAQGLETYRVRVSTEALSFEGAVDDFAQELVIGLSKDATLSGWRVESSNGRSSLILSASVGVHDATVPVLAKLFEDAAVLQLKLVYDLRSTLLP